MINAGTYRSNNKLILLVTNDVSNSAFIESTHIQYCHVNSPAKIFPCIYTLQPGTIIIDHDFLKDEVQNLVRRIRTNPFYAKLKICCLKDSFNRKTDEQLIVTGVNYMVYKNSLATV